MVEKTLDNVREKSEQFGFWVKQSVKLSLKGIWNVLTLIVGGFGMFVLGFLMGIVRIDEKKDVKETKKVFNPREKVLL
jgi:hypothetical protein